MACIQRIVVPSVQERCMDSARLGLHVKKGLVVNGLGRDDSTGSSDSI